MQINKENAEQVSGGVFLVGLGLLFLTGFWWPGIMFVIAASIIARSIAEGQPWNANTSVYWLIGIGLVFWLPGIFNLGMDLLLPGILIAIGAFMLFGGKYRPQIGSSDKPKNDDADRHDATV